MSEERTRFLLDLMITAIENYGYGWFAVESYEPDEGKATIVEQGDDGDGPRHKVNLDTLRKGLKVIREAKLGPETDHNKQLVYCNRETGKNIYMSEGQRANILLCDRTNNDEGDYDVVDALAVLECGIFGAVTFA